MLKLLKLMAKVPIKIQTSSKVIAQCCLLGHEMISLAFKQFEQPQLQVFAFNELQSDEPKLLAGVAGVIFGTWAK